MTFLYGRYLNYVDIDSILIFANIVLFPFSAFVGRVANLISRSNVKLHIFVLEFLHFKYVFAHSFESFDNLSATIVKPGRKLYWSCGDIMDFILGVENSYSNLFKFCRVQVTQVATHVVFCMQLRALQKPICQ